MPQKGHNAAVSPVLTGVYHDNQWLKSKGSEQGAAALRLWHVFIRGAGTVRVSRLAPKIQTHTHRDQILWRSVSG